MTKEWPVSFSVDTAGCPRKVNSWGSASCNQTNTWAGDGPQVPPVVKSVPGGVIETWKTCSLVRHVTLIYNTYTIHVFTSPFMEGNIPWNARPTSNVPRCPKGVQQAISGPPGSRLNHWFCTRPEKALHHCISLVLFCFYPNHQVAVRSQLSINPWWFYSNLIIVFCFPK